MGRPFSYPNFRFFSEEGKGDDGEGGGGVAPNLKQERKGDLRRAKSERGSYGEKVGGGGGGGGGTEMPLNKQQENDRRHAGGLETTTVRSV